MDEKIPEIMIPPCGVDCAVCIGHLREKKKCPGCNSPDDNAKPKHCVDCSIKNCPERGDAPFCGACPKFPCARMKRLDKRYREKYGSDLLDNLRRIESEGITAFAASEVDRWTCTSCGSLFSAHRAECLSCGAPNPRFPS